MSMQQYRTLQRAIAKVVLAGLSGWALMASAAPPGDPSQGDGGVSAFYTWTGDVPRPPGTLLRHEPLPEGLMLENASRGLRILYSSTDGIRGQAPVSASGAVFLPKGTPPAGGWPIVAWAHGTVGIADVCAPSWGGRLQRDATYLNAWLGQGYAIVATDYQGLGTPGGHPYFAARPHAYSVLDSVRAALKGLPGLANAVVVIGQSQGGAAAFAAAGYAPQYAPDINLRGTVATGVPSFSTAHLAKLADRSGDTVDLGIAYTMLLMHLAQQVVPELDPVEYLTDQARAIYERATKACLGELFEATRAAALTRSTVFKKDPLPFLSQTFQYLTYPTLALRQPTFIGIGEKDRDVPPAMQLELVKDSCSAGAPVQAHLYPGLGHSGAVNGSLPDSLPFVRQVMAGGPVASNCGAQPSLPGAAAKN
jgi:pimeloyl-ACP methyl ester carboxylesterase